MPKKAKYGTNVIEGGKLNESEWHKNRQVLHRTKVRSEFAEQAIPYYSQIEGIIMSFCKSTLRLNCFIILILTACAAPSKYNVEYTTIRFTDRAVPSFDYSLIKNVVVLPTVPSEYTKQNLYKYRAEILGQSDNIASYMTELLIKYGTQYSILERSRLEDILREYGLVTIELFDPQNAARIGKLAGADALIIGKGHWEASASLEKLDLSFVEMETGKVLWKETYNRNMLPKGSGWEHWEDIGDGRSRSLHFYEKALRFFLKKISPYNIDRTTRRRTFSLKKKI